MATDPLPVKTAGTTFEVVEAIARHEQASLDTLVSAIDASKSTVYKHLRTLCLLGYVDHTEYGYRLTGRLAALASESESTPEGWRADAREELARLANTTGDVAGLLRLDGNCGEQLLQERGDAARRRGFTVHVSPYLHASAAGKVILSQLEDGTIESIVDARGMPALTAETVTDEDALFEEVRRVRRFGIARAREEQAPGVSGVAAPVRWEGSERAGALYVVGPAGRMTATRLEEDLPEILDTVVSRLGPLSDADRPAHDGLAIPKR